MNRREFLQCAAVLAAGCSLPVTSLGMNHEQQSFVGKHLAAQPNYIDRHPLKFFNPLQRAAITAAAEAIIPATDTPGATDAGVARFIELMLDQWFTEAERQPFMVGLAELQQQAGGDFAALPAVEQVQLLEQLEAAASDAEWYNFANTMRIWDFGAPFVCQLKELTVLGFMLSEVGGSQFLRENPMGVFNGNVPLANDSAFVAEEPMRKLGAEVGTDR
jgi:hypothetical protein